MDKQMVREWQARWDAYAEYQAEEMRNTSIEVRWRQLNAILGMAAALKLTVTQDEEGFEQIWRRWQQLRRAYGINDADGPVT